MSVERAVWARRGVVALRTLLAAGFLVGASLLVPPLASAANFVVDAYFDTADVNPGDGICRDGMGRCSLRAAIMEANTAPGGDTIYLPAGTYTLSLGGRDEDAARSGDLDILDDITIIGSGGDLNGDPSRTVIQAGTSPGTGIDRVFSINPSPWDRTIDAAFHALTIRHGRIFSGDPDFSAGGGLEFDAGPTGEGALTIDNCIIADNQSDSSDGGGLAVFTGDPARGAHVTITRSVLERNQALDGNGGGIFLSAGVSLSLENSEVRSNEAHSTQGGNGNGGGIYSFSGGGSLNLNGSTLAGNRATAQGGGLHTAEAVVMVNSTISGNSAGSQGGGLYITPPASPASRLTNVTITQNQTGSAGGGLAKAGAGGPLQLLNTIVAGNLGATEADVSGTLDPLSAHNLFGHGGSGGLANGVNGNIIAADARLAPLGDNGGRTRTHALLAGSPALDAGSSPSAPNVDQRGIARPLDSADPDTVASVDIGAVEAHPTISSIANQTVSANETLMVDFYVGDDSGTAGPLVVGATSSNTALIPNDPAHLKVEPNGTGARRLTITPTAGAAGNATITVTVIGTDTAYATFNLTVKPTPDLAVTMSHTDPFIPGQSGTYTITVANDNGIGPTDGSFVEVKAGLPAGLVKSSISGTGWSCSLDTLTCTRTDALAQGAAYPNISLRVNVLPTATGTAVATATVSGGGDTNPGNNVAHDSTTFEPRPDLAVAITAPSGTRQGATGFAYQVTVSNNGTAPTSGAATVNLTLPAALQNRHLSGTGWNCDDQNLTCTRADALATGQPYPEISVTADVAADAPASITIGATAATTGDPNASNDSKSVSIPVAQAADLTITKTHTGDFAQGQTDATYTITVTNTGPGPTAGAVTVTEILPEGMAFKAMNGTGWNCNTPLTCTRSDVLPPGASYPSITLTVDVASRAQPSLTNRATVAGGGELTTTNNDASDPTTIRQMPDLAVTKRPVGEFRQGQAEAIYEITIKNQGTGLSSGTVTVAETLPPELTATAISGTGWTCTLASLTCTRTDSLAADGAYPPITLTVSVAPTAPSKVVNTVTVSGGGDVDSSNNTASVDTPIAAMPDLMVSKSHSGNFRQGQKGALYQLAVTNQGEVATAGEVTLTDTLPAGLTATTMEGNGWTCDLASLICRRSDPLFGKQSYPAVTLTVDVADAAPGDVTNKVTVSGGGELHTANNQAEDKTMIDQAADMTITKSHLGDFTQGQTDATYTIIVKNDGLGPTAGAVTMTDVLPEGLTLKSMSGKDWVCNPLTLTCTRSDVLAAGAAYPAITVTGEVAQRAPGSITNIARVSGGGELITTNNEAIDTATVIQQPNLELTITAPQGLTQGQKNAAHTLDLKNSGTGFTTGEVKVTITLPAGLTGTAAPLGGDGWNCDPGTLTCTRSDTLAADASYPSIALAVDVALDAPPEVTVKARAEGGGDASADLKESTTPVVQRADLALAISQTGGVRQGQKGLVYTFQVANQGSAPAADVALVINIPQSLSPVTLEGAGWSCALNELRCTAQAPLAVGTAQPITLTVDVAVDAPDTAEVTAEVSAKDDRYLTNNSQALMVSIVQTADLVVTREIATELRQGQAGRYTLTVTNQGPVPTVGEVTLTQTLGAGLTITKAEGTGWDCQPDGLTCSRSDVLAAGADYPTITIDVEVASDAPAQVAFTAKASGGGEANAANSEWNTPISVTQVADLVVTKSHSGSFYRGQKGATYTIIVKNAGPGATDAPITLVDTLPADLKATAMQGTGWSCDLASLTCTRTDVLPAGQSSPILLRVDVDAKAPNQLINQVAVSGGGELKTDNNTASDTTTVTAPPSSGGGGGAPTPSLTISVPVTETRESTIAVSGTASPSAAVQVNGVAVQADGEGRWQVVVELKEGLNLITAVSGSLSQSVSVLRDTTPPTLELKAEATWTDADSVLLTAVAEAGAKVEIEDKAGSSLRVPLAMGANQFTAKATDRLGNVATAKVQVVRVAAGPVVVEVSPTGGGKVQAGFLTVSMPPGAAASPLRVEVRLAGASEATRQAERAGRLVMAGEVNLSAKADGAPVHDLLRPATLVFRYDPTLVADPSKLVIYYYDPVGKAWVELGGRVDATAGTVTVEVDHFTLFALLEPKAAGPKLAALPVATDSPTITVEGTAKPGEAVSLVVDGVVKATATADGSGAFALKGTLTQGRNRLYVKGAGALASREATVTLQSDPAPALTDVAGHWAAAAIQRMVDLGVTKGYEDNTFRPEAQVTRLEFAVMMARLLNLPESDAPLTFADSASIPSWAQRSLAAAVKAGIISGRANGEFDPNASVTRAEVAIMLVRAMRHAGLTVSPGAIAFADDAEIPAWAKEQVQAAAEAGLVKGYQDGTFRPGLSTTRAEAVTMLGRLLDALAR